MRLYKAIRESDVAAAIITDEKRNWSWVVIAHQFGEYSMESHSYNSDGSMRTIVSVFEKFTAKQLPLKLGGDYESDRWQPYYGTIIQHQNFGRIESKLLRNSSAVGRITQNRYSTRKSNIRRAKPEKLFGLDWES